MDFSLRVSTGVLDESLYTQSWNVSEGLEYFQQIKEKLELPDNVKTKQVRTTDKWFSGNSYTVELDSVITVSKNHRLAITDMTGILDIPKLNTLEYFKDSALVNVIVSQGFISKFIVEYIKNVTYTEKYINKQKGLFSSILPKRKITGGDISYVDVAYTIDWAAFVEEWIDSDCPLYLGIDAETYKRRARIEKKIDIQ